jgi:hypothetical protein
MTQQQQHDPTSRTPPSRTQTSDHEVQGASDAERAVPRAAALRSENRLHQAAERLRGGDFSVLRAAGASGFGMTARGLAPGQEDTHVYLKSDRFKWWDDNPPDTRPIITARDDFDKEFCSPLAIVAGGGLGPGGNEVTLLPAEQTVSWDQFADVWPDIVPGLQFRVRALRPGLAPMIRRVPVRVAGILARTERSVLVNEVAAVEQHPTQPPLIIDFAVPQRVVGLEYGYLGPEVEIPKELVRLVAKDRQGKIVDSSHGGHLIVSVERNLPDSVNNRIAIRSELGEIATVELHFGDEVNPIRVPQIVYRVWHEALPPAAVRQGSVEKIWYGAGDARNQPGTATEALPFDCDQYLVMIRGFALEHFDGPREILGFEIGIQASLSIEPRGERTVRTVTLAASGGCWPLNHSQRVKIYYTLLAWDSRQVAALLSTRRSNRTSGAPTGNAWLDLLQEVANRHQQLSGMRVTDPFPVSPSSFNSEAFGRMFGALQGWAFKLPRVQELGEIDYTFGYPYWEDILADRIFWPAQGKIEGTLLFQHEQEDPNFGGTRRSYQTDQAVERYFSGQILTGPGVAIPDQGNFGVPLTFRTQGPLRRRILTFRRQIEDDADPEIRQTFAGEGFQRLQQGVAGDMAFLSIGFRLWAIPQGPIRLLELEFLGTRYDGTLIEWELYGAISTETDNPDERHDLFALPMYGALSRTAVVATPRVITQNLRFSNGVLGLLALVPDQYGALYNAGAIPVLITHAERLGPHQGDFYFLLEWRNQVLGIDRNGTFVTLRSSSLGYVPGGPLPGPLDLLPGETLLIGARFFPQAEGTHADPRLDVLAFHTNSGIRDVRARGITVPSRADGRWFPDHVNLDESGDSLRAVLENVGHTPLLIESLAFENANLGFQYYLPIGFGGGMPGAAIAPGVALQLDPGESLLLEINQNPRGPTPVETRLIAHSNSLQQPVALVVRGWGLP